MIIKFKLYSTNFVNKKIPIRLIYLFILSLLIIFTFNIEGYVHPTPCWPFLPESIYV